MPDALTVSEKSQIKVGRDFQGYGEPAKKWRDGGRDVGEGRWHHSLWYWILEGILSLDVFLGKGDIQTKLSSVTLFAAAVTPKCCVETIEIDNFVVPQYMPTLPQAEKNTLHNVHICNLLQVPQVPQVPLVPQGRMVPVWAPWGDWRRSWGALTLEKTQMHSHTKLKSKTKTKINTKKRG